MNAPIPYDFSAIRDLRRQHNLTIQDVSQQSGISPAVISKLERNRSRAELDTLFKLARVFSMSASDLLALAERALAHKKNAETHETAGFRFQRVSYANVRCMFGRADAGAQLSKPEVHRDDYELCWVLQGELVISLAGESHTLRPGDALQFDAALEHAYEAVTDCELIIVHLTKSKRF